MRPLEKKTKERRGEERRGEREQARGKEMTREESIGSEERTAAQSLSKFTFKYVNGKKKVY